MHKAIDIEREKEEAREQSGMRFFPDFALREAITASVLLVVLLLLASLTKATLEEVANPQASGYVPRPEWYFLWLFQLLKYFKGPWEPVGTFVLPTLGIALLLSVPLLDRREAKPRVLLPGTRPVRLWPRVIGAVAIMFVGSITLVAVMSSHPMSQPGPELTPLQAAGQDLFGKMGCPTCHTIGDKEGGRGPELTHFASEPGAQDRVLLHFSGIGQAPGSEMPSYQLSAEELRALTGYLMSLK